MKKKIPSRKRTIINCTIFVVIFLLILTALTLLYLPKFDGDARPSRCFYSEEENSIDVLMLGSCNMYSSYMPLIAYEQFGIVSYAYCCPDQEICTAYHYLKEALKTQDVKTVVLESLFLTCEPTAKREYYNRLAVEYMRPSLNKAQLILELGGMESEWMQSLDPSSPGKLLTYAGYFFPLLRYHGREDITDEDISFWSEEDNYTMYKGGMPLYSYLRNPSLDFEYVNNGEVVRDTSREYFEKIKALCEEEGINFLLVKSPNHYRWNETATAAVTEFAAEQGVDFLDFFTYDDFIPSDYSSTTGRLNIYGMKRFTEHLSEYLIANYGVTAGDLSEENREKWDSAVKTLHRSAKSHGMSIDEAQIYRVLNEETGIRLYWNKALDSSSYSVYRSLKGEDNYTKIATVQATNYLDEDVTHGQRYTYYIVPEEGNMAGTESNRRTYAFVMAPETASAVNADGKIQLEWSAVEGITSYSIHRKSWDTLNFNYYDKTTKESYLNADVKNGVLYDYRIRTLLTIDGEDYMSASKVVSAMPVKKAQITSCESGSTGVTVEWKKPSLYGEAEIYRSNSEDGEYLLLGTTNSEDCVYLDESAKSGENYYYQIRFVKTKCDVVSAGKYSDIMTN